MVAIYELQRTPHPPPHRSQSSWSVLRVVLALSLQANSLVIQSLLSTDYPLGLTGPNREGKKSPFSLRTLWRDGTQQTLLMNSER